jgi:hypothetical protein
LGSYTPVSFSVCFLVLICACPESFLLRFCKLQTGSDLYVCFPDKHTDKRG